MTYEQPGGHALDAEIDQLERLLGIPRARRYATLRAARPPVQAQEQAAVPNLQAEQESPAEAEAPAVQPTIKETTAAKPRLVRLPLRKALAEMAGKKRADNLIVKARMGGQSRVDVAREIVKLMHGDVGLAAHICNVSRGSVCAWRKRKWKHKPSVILRTRRDSS